MPVSAYAIQGRPVWKHGYVVEDALAYFYDAGTTTPRTVYANPELTPLAWPVPLDGWLNFPAIYVSGTTPYDIRVTDGDGAVLVEYQEQPGEAVESTPDPTTGTTIPVGMVGWRYGTGKIDEWVRLNGRQIGSANSGANELASATAYDLYVHLWTVDTTLAVSGGRGATAQADWDGDKHLTLPDARGRSLHGLDDMGGSSAARLTGGTFGTGDGITLGSTIGAATHTLTIAQLAAHDHPATGTAASDGAHIHTGTADSGGAHQHDYVDSTYAQDGSTGAGSYSRATLTEVTKTSTSNGAHTHTLTIASGGSHTHTLTIDTTNTGGGDAHNNLVPGILGTWYMKL